MNRFRKWAAALVMGLCWQGSAHAEWWQAKTQHFTVFSAGRDEAALRSFAERLEKFDYLLRSVTHMSDPQMISPVKVYILPNEAGVKRLAGSRNVAGFYFTSDRSGIAVLSREGKTHKFDLGAEEVLFHEYTHHFMLQHFPAAYPAWYVEGFAELFSVVKFARDGSIGFGHVPMARVPGLVLGQPYPMAQLFARDTDGLSLRDGDRYYGTAWLLTHFLQYDKSGRRQEILNYLNDTARGVANRDPDSYFSGGLNDLEKDVKAYMRHNLSMTKLTPAELKIGTIEITPLDAAQAALVTEELSIHRATPEDGVRMVNVIRMTLEKYPDNAYALTLLAEAESAADRKDAALQDAERAIAIDPRSSRAHIVRAKIWLERAQQTDKAEDWKAALTAIVRANRADTEDPVPLALFYRYHRMRGGTMPATGYDGLYKAFNLLPQNVDYRFTAAAAMAEQKNYEGASMLLNPIAYSPHGSERRDAAMSLKVRYDAEAAKHPKTAIKASSAENPAPAP